MPFSMRISCYLFSVYRSSNGSGTSQFLEESFDEDYLNEQISTTPDIKEFTLQELKVATRNFRDDVLLGEGGFGKVYKRMLNSSGEAMVVAIKKLRSDSYQGFDEWYTSMFAVVIAVNPLPWELRLKIAIGAARGLALLHATDRRVIYRDFKTSNLLLDREYNAKLSDFGLAKIVLLVNLILMTKVRGTYGYAAPEYVTTGRLYMKSEVYAFGVADWVKPYLSNKIPQHGQESWHHLFARICTRIST
ncbi:putative serine/threonine-protein kinase PIX13 [Drosera capensis]